MLYLFLDSDIEFHLLINRNFEVVQSLPPLYNQKMQNVIHKVFCVSEQSFAVLE